MYSSCSKTKYCKCTLGFQINLFIVVLFNKVCCLGLPFLIMGRKNFQFLHLENVLLANNKNPGSLGNSVLP